MKIRYVVISAIAVTRACEWSEKWSEVGPVEQEQSGSRA